MNKIQKIDDVTKSNEKLANPENKMGTMPIGKLLASMSWPAILSMTINAMYNIVDSIFVSKLGDDALAAVTLAFPIQMFLIAITVGTGVGINSLISRRLGAKRFDEANKAAEHGLRIAFVSWSFFLIFGIFFARPYMDAYSDTPFIIENGTIFLRIVLIGSIFSIIAITIEKTLQATGNMILPMISSITGALINIALNPILVLGLFGAPKLGVAGAAVATLAGQFVNMIMALVILIKFDKSFHIRLKGFKVDWNIVKDIYGVGLPAIIMQSISSVMLLGFNAIIAASNTAIAVLGAYFRLQSFIFLPTFGLSQGTMPIIGYNYGARNRKRLMEAFNVSFLAAFIYMFTGLIVFQIMPEKLMALFSASDAMVAMGIPALRIISICFIPASFAVISATLFQGTGHGILSLMSSLVRQLVGILPIAWLLVHFKGINSVWWAFPLAEILGFSFAIFVFLRLYRNTIKGLDEKGDLQKFPF